MTHDNGMTKDLDGRLTVLITREQLECWAGRPLTDAQVSDIDDCIPHSSIPEAIYVIANSVLPDDDDDECDPRQDLPGGPARNARINTNG